MVWKESPIPVSIVILDSVTNIAQVGPITKIFQHCYKNISRYDLEANLALLKLYQFNPTYNNLTVVVQILLKSLTNLPHTDFVLCKCLLSQEVLEEPQVTSSSSN